LREGYEHGKKKSYQESLAACEPALRLKPNYVPASSGKEEVLQNLNRFKAQQQVQAVPAGSPHAPLTSSQMHQVIRAQTVLNNPSHRTLHQRNLSAVVCFLIGIFFIIYSIFGIIPNIAGSILNFAFFGFDLFLGLFGLFLCFGGLMILRSKDT